MNMLKIQYIMRDLIYYFYILIYQLNNKCGNNDDIYNPLF